MNFEQLGNLGEFVAAIATVITLVYLTFQLRQNTRALRATAFQSVVSEMGKNVEPLLSDDGLAEIFLKAVAEPDHLTALENIRLNAMYVSTFRRLEAVYVQYTLGTIEEENKRGFEASIIPLLKSQHCSNWWSEAKSSFYGPYVEHLDDRLASGNVLERSPSIQVDV